MKKSLFTVVGLAIICLLSCSPTANEVGDVKMWYESPAENWNDALPLGNGRMAAMVFGGIDAEVYQINEESLWAGRPENPFAENYYEKLQVLQQMVLDGELTKAHDFGLENLVTEPTFFRSYEPFADLLIEFNGQGTVTDYKRELDMSTGINRVSYKAGDAKITRESFISAVDDVLVVRFQSSEKGAINCRIELQRPKDAKVIAIEGGGLNIDGQIVDVESPDPDHISSFARSGSGGEHMRFAGRLISENSGGNIRADQNALVVENADEVVLIFTAATDYNVNNFNFDRSINPGEVADQVLAKAQVKSWKNLKQAHVDEHSEMFNRVSFKLGSILNDTIPTDKRLEAYKEGSEDLGLITQMFQFGRYLLMSSSRAPAILPANLQGKWNKDMWAPWRSDYHLNVNLQMNYWPADVCNLSETTEPLTMFMEQLSKISNPIAKEMFHANGWFAAHSSNPFGRVTPVGSTSTSQFINGVLDVLAGAWMIMNLWDHYEFTQNHQFLEERLYPLLKGSSEFILYVLIPDSEGYLQFVPSASPENAFIDSETGRVIRISATSTYHLTVIKAIFQATLEASEILGIDDPVIARINEAENKLPGFLIGKDGRLKEWRHDHQEQIPTHRHFSHLLGVHPFAIINIDDTPDLFDAAKKSLDERMQGRDGVGVGWSAAEASLLSAWFYDVDRAYTGVRNILSQRTNKTFLHAGRIFQIDANFGVTSAIAEMLIQSHRKDQNGNFVIDLLPAIPDDWHAGSVKGLRSRGGFEVDIEWEEGSITKAGIKSITGGKCSARYKDSLTELTLKAGERIILQEL